MVYINSWQEYQDAAEALYKKSPFKVCYFPPGIKKITDRVADSLLREMEVIRRKAGAENN